MKMGSYAIFFLQRLNLTSWDYIILDRTHSFHRISGNLLKNLRKLSKSLSPTKLDQKVGILWCERMETIIHFRKNMMAQLHLIIKKNKRLYKRLEKPNDESLFNYKIEGNYFEGKIWALYKLKTKASGKG